MKPFRWNLKKREQLGHLLNGEVSKTIDDFQYHLIDCASKVLASSGGSDLVFVGRSPENLFDYLSGVFDGSTWEEKVHLLNVSNRFQDINQIKSEMPSNYNALREHFDALSLSPEKIIRSETGVCFIDLVASGGTFEQLFYFLLNWCKDIHEDYNALKRKIRFTGITEIKENSPNTWRWQQHADWVKTNKEVTVKNVSIPWVLWDLLGNIQDKVSPTNPPEKWNKESLFIPPRDEKNLKALRLAYDIYIAGRNSKKRFTNKLAGHHNIKEKWLRDLVSDLRANK
ncbi:MAG: hypothetical protein ACRBCI_15180 [Cellvibrionaceae bacterium]